MPAGKEIGAFALKATTHTVSPGPGNSVVLAVNLEGTQTGEISGEVLGTLTVGFDPESDSGTYTWSGWGALDGGQNVTMQGQGTYESSGVHTWRFNGTNRLSDGSTSIVEAVGDLAKRSIEGKLYESVAGSS